MIRSCYKVLVILLIASLSACTLSRGRGASAPSEGTAELAGSFEEHPGLGTAWGETVDSRVHNTTFERESWTPEEVLTLHYNDRKGIKAMSGLELEKFQKRGYEMLDGDVQVGVVQAAAESRRTVYLPTASRSEKNYVIGENGEDYALLIKNKSDERIEAVFSVDGLDVMDGARASTTKRGYIIDPGEEFLVKGFRKSNDEVAAFRFSSVDNSYAALRHDDTENVGIIGCAIFHEKEESVSNEGFATPPPTKTRAEASRRKRAKAFDD